MSSVQSFIAELRTTAWRTAGARFNASRRLKRRDWFATLSIAMFSAIGVALVVVQKVYELQPGSAVDNYITVLSACIGLFVIVISLIEWGAAGSLKTDALHRNAEQINQFQRKLGLVLAEMADGHTPVGGAIKQLHEEYEAIKATCQFNHEPIDDLLFKVQHRSSPEFSNSHGAASVSWLECQWIKVSSLLSSVWYFGFFWFVILALVGATTKGLL